MNIRPVIATAALMVAGILAPPAQAHDYRLGDLRIEHPWSRATPPGAPGVGYMKIVNDGERSRRLVGASSPAAERTRIHRSVERDGTSKMVHQDNGVAIAPGDTVAFEPGSYHLMLTDLHEPLEAEQRVPVTLEFEQAGSVTVELVVKPLTDEGAHSGH